MPKRFSFKLTLLLILLTYGFALAQQSSSSKSRQSAQPEAANKAVITAAQVNAMTEEVLKQVSEIRGLKLLHPVKSGVKSRDEIKEMVIKNFNEESTPQELDADFKTLVAFGLVPKNFQYRSFLINLLTEQIAGFYDPKTKEFNLANWNPLSTQKTVMAHELTHALQDQHFDLKRFDKWPKEDGDREMAIHALIEGDATALMMDYLMKPMGGGVTKLPLSILTKMVTEMNSSGMKEFDSAPNAIREALIFPYSYGLIFNSELLKDKGWDGVSKAYQKLPQSTEQIMHYGKYATNEMPVKVELIDLSKDLGTGWKRINRDVNGEFGYYLALAEYLEKSDARNAAAGWGGDQYAVYENQDKTQVVLTHLSVWDSEDEAEEFFKAYLARTEKRYPQAQKNANSPLTKSVYSTVDGETLIEKRGKSVLAIEGATRSSAEKLTAKLWTSKVGE